MKPHHLLIVLLVAAALSVDAAVVAANRDGSTLPILLALATAQIGLLAAWLVWGRCSLVLRLAVWIAAVALWSIPLSQFNDRPVAEWLTALAFYSLLIVAPLLLLRIMRYRITWPSMAEVGPSQALQRWQFSLWNLFCFTTGVAMLLGMGRLFRLQWALAWEMTLFCGALALVTVVALLAVLSARSALLPIVASALAALLVGRLLTMQGGGVNYTLVAAIEAAFVGLSVLVVRVGEFRLEAAQVTPALSRSLPARSSTSRG